MSYSCSVLFAKEIFSLNYLLPLLFTIQDQTSGVCASTTAETARETTAGMSVILLVCNIFPQASVTQEAA